MITIVLLHVIRLRGSAAILSEIQNHLDNVAVYFLK